MPIQPTFYREEALWQAGVRLVAGVDEVGRGPLAGPVVAAAVILPPRAQFAWLGRVRDSKVLAPAIRETLAALIREAALAVGIGALTPQRIDEIGIGAASRLAMTEALDALDPAAEFALVDGFRLRELALPHEGIVDGDALCLSIAAASIVAKVERDRLMTAYEEAHPGYGFARHKGYPTPGHLQALSALGPCAIHRRSFAPVRACLDCSGAGGSAS